MPQDSESAELFVKMDLRQLKTVIIALFAIQVDQTFCFWGDITIWLTILSETRDKKLV